MTDLLRGFFQLIVWTFVPVMATIVLFRAYLLSKGSAAVEYQAPVRAGFWGGFVLFLIIFVAQVGRFVQNGFPDASIYQGFNPFLALGAAVGMFALLYGRRMVPLKLLGWLVLGVTALSLWSLFHYLFIHTANEYILSLTLGTALGVFAHTSFPPMHK
jgi:hypothetical protein